MSTFTLDYEVDASQLQGLVKALQNVKTESAQAATALGQVGTAAGTQTAPGVKKAADEMHGLSLNSAGARRELIVLAHEMAQGNWSRFGGSIMVMAERMDAMKLIMSPLGLGVAAVAAAFALVAVAAVKGANEQAHFNNALILTGNYAGTTGDALRAMSLDAANTTHAIGTAKEVVASLANSGKFTATQIDAIGKAATGMAVVTGEKVDEVVKHFEKLADEPTKASAELNKQYHYLTEAVYAQIKALEEQGKVADAADLAERQFAQAMDARTKLIESNLGSLQRAWMNVKKWAGEAWDSMLGIGRAESLDDRIAAMQKALAQHVERNQNIGVKPGKVTLDLQQELAAALQEKFRTEEAAAAKGQIASDQQAAITAKDKVQRLQEQLKGQEAVNRELKKYHDELDDIRKVNPNDASLSSDAVKRGEDEIRKRYGGSQSAVHKSYQSEIAELRGFIDVKKVLLDTDLTNLQAAFARGEMSEEEYENKKADLKKKQIQLEIDTDGQMLDVARKYGTDTKVDQQKFLADKQKHIAELGLVDAQREKDVAAHNKRLKGLQDEALREAEKYNALLKAANDKANRQLFMTDNERTVADKQDAINNKYNDLIEKQRQALTRDGANPAQIKADIVQLEAERDKALQIEEDSMTKRLQLQSDWENGARLAWKQYLEDAQNVAKQTQELFSKAFNGLEDALVNFVSTGKGNFKQLAQSIIQDLIRIQIRAAMSGIFKMIGFPFGGGGSAGGSFLDAGSSGISTFAATGGVFAGGMRLLAQGGVLNGPTMLQPGVMAGEAGTEAVFPVKRMPNGNLGVQAQGGGGVYAPQITVQITTGSGDPKEIAKTVAQEVAKQQHQMKTIADGQIHKSWTPGGISYKNFRRV